MGYHKTIQMVDLVTQAEKLQPALSQAMQNVVSSAAFIQGPEVKSFAQSLALSQQVKYAIPCANGTDALQLALMALELKPGDEVLVPVFTYVATAEVIALLQLIPVMVDVDPDTFMIDVEAARKAISPRTKAIVPVHLFGQCAPMEELLDMAKKYGLWVVEDTAQALGAEFVFSDGKTAKAGTMGHIGTTSFFPSKNLGCFGDGGALLTQDDALAEKLKMIANHGQKVKYYHDVIGVNSRLDTLQAAILLIKLPFLAAYTSARNEAAAFYDAALADCDGLRIPVRVTQSTHVFHQYTLRVLNGRRDELMAFLAQEGIPSMVYYPVPLHLQKAYAQSNVPEGSFPVAEQLAKEVLSLPMHTELNTQELTFIVQTIKSFYRS